MFLYPSLCFCETPCECALSFPEHWRLRHIHGHILEQVMFLPHVVGHVYISVSFLPAISLSLLLAVLCYQRVVDVVWVFRGGQHCV